MSAQQADNRHRMLKVVRETWIDGYLKHSLDNVVRVELGLEENPSLEECCATIKTMSVASIKPH